MTRSCPRCLTTFAGDERFCPNDGAPLVDTRPVEGRRGAASESTPTDRVARPPRYATLSGGVVDGRYEIIRRLGEGGMSYVYEARDRDTGETVALKILSPGLREEPVATERLRREAGVAMRLRHPHACPILRLGETEHGVPYVVMPYLEGELLSEREDRVGPLPLESGIEFLVQICAGLHHAHALKIVHRDLKPENVMIVADESGREQAVLMDFGLAKDVEPGPASLRLTGAGRIPGTPEFMSPEQVRGRPMDARSDVYGLGVLAFEMFAGRLPFHGRTTQEMMVTRLQAPPLPVRQIRAELPAALEPVLRKALEVEPDARYRSARDFGLALAGVLGEAHVARLSALFD